MTVHDVVQRSAEWSALRCGRFCGSRAADMLAIKMPEPFTPTGKPSKAKPQELAGRRNLRAQLVLEILTGKPQERAFQSQAMQDGIDREDEALGFYEATSDRPVFPVGFVSHDELRAGCSPDGVIGDFEGLVEAKCPLPATHLTYLETGKVPFDYEAQILHGLWITGAKWCDWISYHPDFPEPLRLRVVRVTFTPEQIADYDAKARVFLREVEEKVAALATMSDLAGRLKASAGAA